MIERRDGKFSSKFYIAHMNNKNIPRLLLGSWIPKASRNGNSGRAQQTIRNAYTYTLQKLGY